MNALMTTLLTLLLTSATGNIVPAGNINFSGSMSMSAGAEVASAKDVRPMSNFEEGRGGRICPQRNTSPADATPRESASMENTDTVMRLEADAFLKNMPAGLQDRQTLAVLKAIAGDLVDLDAVRNSRNSASELPEGVTAFYPTPDLRVYIPTFEIIPKNTKEVEVNAEGQTGVHPEARSDSRYGHATAKGLPVLVYFHGGGWTFGSINSCSRFCGELAAKAGIIVVAADYRLAPEHPFPQGLEDCIEAIIYAHDHALEWGGDPTLISVGGDSSGGNLAIASALYLNGMGSGCSFGVASIGTSGMDKENPSGETADRIRLRSLLLFYPVTKAFNDGSDSWKRYGHGFGLDSDLMNAFNLAYTTPCTLEISDNRTTLPDEKQHVRPYTKSCPEGCCGDIDPNQPLISPGLASKELLAVLPKTLIVAAERDILRDQGIEFTRRLEQASVSVQRIELPGTVHLFITVPGQNAAFNKAVSLAAGFLE